MADSRPPPLSSPPGGSLFASGDGAPLWRDDARNPETPAPRCTPCSAIPPKYVLVIAILLVSGFLQIWGNWQAHAAGDDGVGPDPVEGFLRGRFEYAREQYRLGNYLVAFRLADAILTLAPDVPFRGELRQLRRRAEARHLGASTLHVLFERRSLRPSRTASGSEVESTGEAFPLSVLRGVVHVENVSEEKLIVEAPRERALGQCQFRLLEIGGDGAQWLQRGSLWLRSRGDFVLRPGEQREEPFEIELASGPGRPVLQVVEVWGVFRPRQLQAGERVIGRSIPWQRSEFVVLAPDLVGIERDPFSELKRALQEENSRRLAAAGVLWIRALDERDPLAAEERRETIESLLGALDPESDGPLDRLVMELLEQLTGLEIRPVRSEWLRWGKKQARGRAASDVGQ